jgi:hypothetical protein
MQKRFLKIALVNKPLVALDVIDLFCLFDTYAGEQQS